MKSGSDNSRNSCRVVFCIFQTVIQTKEPDSHVKGVLPLKLVLAAAGGCHVCAFQAGLVQNLRASASFGGASPATPPCAPLWEKEN